MNMLIMGPPGSGKGTQSKLLTEEYKIPHISTGDMFRTAIREESELGLLAKSYIDKGQYVPDDVTIELVRERLALPDCLDGFLLDGFPRTLAQAIALDEMLESVGKKLDHVLKIDVDSYMIVKRLAGRRVCPNCEASFHIEYAAPKEEGVCDVCGSDLMRRSDDDPETAIKRLEVYLQSTYPLIEYYDDRELLRSVFGVGTIEKVFTRFKRVLGQND